MWFKKKEKKYEESYVRSIKGYFAGISSLDTNAVINIMISLFEELDNKEAISQVKKIRTYYNERINDLSTINYKLKEVMKEYYGRDI